MNQRHKANIANLAKNHGRQVFHSAFRLLRDAHLAEDVTQEVFLKLFKKSPSSFNTITHWPAYLKSMAISTAIDHLRRHTRLAESPMEAVPEPQTIHAEQPLQLILQDRDLQCLLKALLRLDAKDARIFCMRHIEGYSYQEIADIEGISSSLVGVTLHRTQIKVSSHLGESQFLGEQHVV
ncbi:RNA polymerase sigma factor [Ningiella sp. W23]|uniref:RNA polymerase sigma factor n=1 Tax=Ningiella sp. W23 TaxID=3023715 RepID=UPI003757DA72